MNTTKYPNYETQKKTTMLMLLIIIAFKKSASYWIYQFRQLKNELQKIFFVIFACNMFVLKSNCQSQTSVFEAVRKGEKIGELYATKTKTGINTALRVSTFIHTRFIFDVSVETDAQTTFRNDMMCNVRYIKKVNGSEKLYNIITPYNTGYVIKSKNGDRTYKNEIITGTSISMYFNEPLNLTSLYSEMFLTYVTVTCLQPGKYKIEMPDGSVNYYFYSNGILVMVEINSTFFTVKFVLKSSSQKPILTSTK